MAGQAGTVRGPCSITPTWVAVVVVIDMLMLLASYSHHITISNVTSHLLQRDAWIQRTLNRSIEWQLKDAHPPHVPTDILRLERPEYADDFKNPCWREQNRGSIRVRCLPYFFIAGMPKSGTTDLYSSLGHHPQIQLPSLKEPQWWERTRYKKRVSMETYVKHFDESAEHIQKNFIKQEGRRYHPIITGDGSAHTFWDNSKWRKIPQNYNTSSLPHVVHAHLIKHLIPDGKIIVLFRNPTDRLYSAYLYYNEEKRKSKDMFHNQSLRAISAWRTCVERHTPRFCAYRNLANFTYLGRSDLPVHLTVNMYGIYAKEWLEIFPREQMHFIEFQEYSLNRAKVLQEVSKFLDLDSFFDTDLVNRLSIKNQRRIKAGRLGPMHNKTRQLLEQFYAPYNKELASVLGDKRFLFT